MVLPLASGPKISMMRRRAGRGRPKAMSRLSAHFPVEMPGTSGAEVADPQLHDGALSPNCFSIRESAALEFPVMGCIGHFKTPSR